MGTGFYRGNKNILKLIVSWLYNSVKMLKPTKLLMVEYYCIELHLKKAIIKILKRAINSTWSENKEDLRKVRISDLEKWTPLE